VVAVVCLAVQDMHKHSHEQFFSPAPPVRGLPALQRISQIFSGLCDFAFLCRRVVLYVLYEVVILVFLPFLTPLN